MKFSMSSKSLLQIIFMISLLATVGSLYFWYFGDPLTNILSGELFNKANGIAACDLCRYIRIFQFPILLISAIALLRNDYHSVVYMGPLALIWGIISLYKYALEMWWLVDKWLCGINSAASCSSTPIMYRGFVTLAFLGVVSFWVTLIACKIIKKRISSPLSA